MKNNYRKLKFSMLLQTLLVTALTVLVGGFLLNYVIDGIYNDSFANIFVDVMMALHVDEQTAIDWYWRLIGDNKTFYMIVGFLLLFAAFFYIALTKMTRYVDQIGDGIENIVSDSNEPIHLITELKPIEIRLNEIKATIRRQELEAAEFTAAAGGGAVEVTVTGKKEVTKVKLDPEAVDPDDVEMLEDLVMAAVNEALRKADEASAASMAKLTGGLGGGFPF